MSPLSAPDAARRPTLARVALPLLGAAAGVLSVLFNLGSDLSGSALAVLGDVAAVSLAAASILIFLDGSSRRWGVAAPWIACGAVVGAGLLGPLRLAPYVLVTALVFASIGAGRSVGDLRARLRHAGMLAAAALVNFSCLWPWTLGQYRPADIAPYLSLNLRAHTLVSDVPLHDVWHVHLPDSVGGQTLVDVDEAMLNGGVGDVTVALAAAVAAYALAARVFGLARAECRDTVFSVRRRLTEADRARSISPAGQDGFVYRFEREALLEIQTCAAHAIYVFALRPEAEGYGLYWGVYARPVNWFTPYYMKLIDPMRRLVVYPSLLQRFEQRWRDRRRGSPSDAPAPRAP